MTFLVNPHRFGWLPSNLSLLTFWFESQDNASFTLSGSSVTGWINKAGATTATAVNTPTRQTVNSRQMLRFNGTNQLCLVANNAEYNFGSGDFSIWTVSRSDDTNRGAIVAKAGGTPGYTMRYNDPDSNAGNFLHFARESTTAQHFGAITVADVTYNNNTVRIIGMQRDGGTLRAFNGATQISTADVSLMGSIDDATRAFNIGALGGAAPLGSGAVHLLKGDIGELIGVKRNLDAAERAALVGYLTVKWGL